MLDIRDLNTQIAKVKRLFYMTVPNQNASYHILHSQLPDTFQMQKLTHDPAPPTSTPVELHLPGDYEVQVAVHLTLVQLQTFSQDLARCLRGLDRSADEEIES